jgi:hypothetical protein
MSLILLLVSIDDPISMKITEVISEFLLDRENEVEVYSFEDAPSGINLNRYDGIVLGIHFDLQKKFKNQLRWIFNNQEIVCKKAFFLFLVDFNPTTISFKDNTGQSSILSFEKLFQLDSVNYLKLDFDQKDETINKNITLIISATEEFSNKVNLYSSSGLSFLNHSKRDYLNFSNKISFPFRNYVFKKS